MIRRANIEQITAHIPLIDCENQLGRCLFDQEARNCTIAVSLGYIYRLASDITYYALSS